jgi:hypothetical protein
MAAERFSLLLESTTRGTAEVEKLEKALVRVLDTAERTGKRVAESMKKTADSARQEAEGIKNAIANPLDAAGEAAENFILRFGKVGGVVAGVGVVLTGTAAAAVTLVAKVGGAADEMANFAERTGLTVNQVDRLQAMAKLADVNIGGLEAQSKVLAAALSDAGGSGDAARKALETLGVAAFDTKGRQRDLGGVMLEVFERLGDVKSQADRVSLAQQILGRGANEVLPLIRNYKELEEEVKRLGFGFDENLLAKLGQSSDEIDKLGLKWELLKRKLAEKAIGVVEIVTSVVNAAETAGAVSGTVSSSLPFAIGQHLRYGKEVALGLRDPANRGKYDLVGLSRPSAPTYAGAVATMDATIADQRARNEAATAYRSERSRTAEGQRQRLAEIETEIADADRKLIQSVDIETRKTLSDQMASLRRERAGIEAAIEAAKENEAARKKLAEQREAERLKRLERTDPQAAYYTNLNRGTALVNGLLGQLPDFRGVFMADMSGSEANEQERLAAYGAGLIASRQTSDARRLATLQQTIDLESRRIELIAGPGGELAAARQIAELRLGSLQQQIALGRDIADADLEAARIRKEFELQILDLKRQQREQGRNTFTSLFDAGVAGGQGLRSFFTSTALSIPRTIAGNLGAEFGGLTGRFSLGLGGLPGRLLAGTPFGADPLKQAGDIQLTAAQIQLDAAKIQAGAATGGIGGTFGGGVSSLSPFIFSATNRSSTPGLVVTDALGLTMPTLNTNGTVTAGSKMSGLTKGIGIGGLIAGGAFGAYSGFSAGGAQGILTGGSSLAGMTAGLLPLLGVSGPAAPLVALGGLALGGIAALLGDPKKRRAEGMQAEAERRRFDDPVGTAYTSDIYGRQLDYDYQGRTRSIVVNNYNTINAVDAPSFIDLVERNAVEVTSKITQTISGGNADDLVGVLKQAM